MAPSILIRPTRSAGHPSTVPNSQIAISTRRLIRTRQAIAKNGERKGESRCAWEPGSSMNLVVIGALCQGSARFWTVPVRWRFGPFQHPPNVAEDCRSPRRCRVDVRAASVHNRKARFGYRGGFPWTGAGTRGCACLADPRPERLAVSRTGAGVMAQRKPPDQLGEDKTKDAHRHQGHHFPRRTQPA
jgi:hypothetical protein